MTNPNKLRQLEFAESRKRKAEKSAKEKQPGRGRKKTNGASTTKSKELNINTQTTHQHTNDSNEPNTNEDANMTANFNRNHKILYTMKLHTNGGIEPLKVLQRTLQDWFKTMKSCVNSFVLFETADGDAVIGRHDQITSNLQFLKRFFRGIRLRTGTSDVWFTACITTKTKRK